MIEGIGGTDILALLFALAAGGGFLAWLFRNATTRPRPVHPDEMPSTEAKRAAKRQADAEAAHAETHRVNVDALTDPDGKAKRDKLTTTARDRLDSSRGKRGSAAPGVLFMLAFIVLLASGCSTMLQPVEGPCRPIAVKPLVYDVVMCRPDAVIDVRPEAISCRCDWETS